MPKTIMAPSRRVLSLGIILLLVSHLSESSPSPDEQTATKVNAQNRVEIEVDTAQEGEQVTSKLSFFNSKGVKVISFGRVDYELVIVFARAGLDYSSELPIFCNVR